MKVIIALALTLTFAGPLGTGEQGSATAAPQEEPATTAQTEEPEDDTDELEEFIPSEEVPADSAISFPVDI